MRLFFTSLKVMYLHKLFEILHGGFVSSPPFICSVIYLHHCDHIFCVFSSTTLFLLKLFWLWSLRPLSFGSCDPLTNTQYLFVCVCVCVCVCVFVIFILIFILFGTIRCFKFILYIPCFIPRISHFFKEPWFFLMTTDTRNQYTETSILEIRYRYKIWEVNVICCF